MQPAARRPSARIGALLVSLVWLVALACGDATEKALPPDARGDATRPTASGARASSQDDAGANGASSGNASPNASASSAAAQDAAPTSTSTSTAASAPEDVEALTARERCAAFAAKERFGQALEQLQPLLGRAQPAAQDLVNAGLIQNANNQVDDAIASFERALALAPDDARAHYGLGWAYLARADVAEIDKGIQSFERALELVPDDAPAMLMLATLYEWRSEDKELARPTDLARMIALRERVLERGVEFGGSWYLSALYQHAQYLLREQRADEAAVLTRRLDELVASGIKRATSLGYYQGTLGLVAAPAPRARRAIAAPSAPRWAAPRAIAQAGALELRRASPAETWLQVGDDKPRYELGADALVARRANGLFALAAPDWNARAIVEGELTASSNLDLDRNGKLDFLVADARGARLLVETEAELSADERAALARDPFGKPPRFGTFERWVASPLALPALESPPTRFVCVDEDHDGDVDVVVLGAFGARLWRNDGVDRAILDAQRKKHEREVEEARQLGKDAPPAPSEGAPLGTFHDATKEAGLAELGAVSWCVCDDFDGDQDVDLLFGGPSGWRLLDNQRGGVFARKSSGEPQSVPADVEPIAADLDGDARTDLWLAGAGARVLLAKPGGGFAEVECGSREPAARSLAHGALADLDLDGNLDVVAPADGALYAGRLALGKLPETPFTGPAGASALSIACGDFNDDGAPDLARSTATGIEILDGESNGNRGVRIALAGRKDNRRALGAIAELRAGSTYRRIYWNGEPELVGVGKAERIDILRVRWPNGVLQQELDLPAGAKRVYPQAEGLGGSCPFLYTWNGERYVYITDVLGITPLGLPMAPGVLVPPDHDEYVLVRGEDLAPRLLDDGRRVLELQLTEELREVTYLDHVRLDVVDHPREVEIHPNERFTFPPFPEAHTHTVRDALAPLAARGSDARDWTAALQRDDSSYAIPFRALRGASEGQYLGLADPWWLELEFDAQRIAAANKLRFVMTGWFYWTDASVNMAAARSGDVAFVPPLLELEQPDGTWKPVGPPLGFPAGKRKTMVVDAAPWLEHVQAALREPHAPRTLKLRVSTTLRLYWDSIRIALDDDDAPLATTALAPLETELWERGFSRNVRVHDGELLEWFEWDELEPFPRWNQHPGSYTKLGAVDELVASVDDRFAVLGSGDALRVRFDTTRLPPLRDGWKRDYLLYLDGWAKDRDPNTVEALYVEPLPFHGMSAYPYPPSERFPDDALHRRWREQWQTRPAKRWIEPVCPAGELVLPAAAAPR